MPSSARRLRYGAILKAIEFPEAYWRYGAVISGRSAQRYIGAGGGGFARPYPADDVLKAGGHWRWYHPWVYRLRVLLPAGVAKTITVTCVCTTGMAPRPTLRLLANPAIGIAEQAVVAPAAPDVEQALVLTATAAATGTAWVQLEWLARPAGQRGQDWCGWKAIAVAET